MGTDAAVMANPALPPADSPPQSIALLRVLIGALQGLALYGLYYAGKHNLGLATQPMVFAPLVLLALFVPLLLIVSVGHMRAKALALWIGSLCLLLAGLAIYDQWRTIRALSVNGWGLASDASDKTKFPSVLLGLFAAVACFIAHALVTAACLEGRRIASYSAYFDAAWKLLVQLKFSTLFVGTFLLLLYLGASLFKLVKLNFLHDAMQEAWFVIPVCMTAFSFALNLTDVRPAIVNSIRNLLLVMQSWTLPLAVFIIGGFLLTLPFSGLDALWATKRATAIVLFAVAALVILINTAFQNGHTAEQVPAVLRRSAWVACLLLLPLTLLAAYALGLRVSAYSWTIDRIIAASCVVVAACYALGYLWAALKSPVWLAKIAPVNIACAMLVVALIVGLFSPLLDPARLAVNAQLARLHSGVQSPETFDFAYLKFEGKRFGADALAQLAANPNQANAATIQKQVALVMAMKYKNDPDAQLASQFDDLKANLTVYPKGEVLPDSFLRQEWKGKAASWETPDCFFKKTARCDVIALDLDGDGVNEWLVIDTRPRSSRGMLFKQTPTGGWANAGFLTENLCESHIEALKRGRFALKAPLTKDIEIAGQRFVTRNSYSPPDNCP